MRSKGRRPREIRSGGGLRRGWGNGGGVGGVWTKWQCTGALSKVFNERADPGLFVKSKMVRFQSSHTASKSRKTRFVSSFRMRNGKPSDA